MSYFLRILHRNHVLARPLASLAGNGFGLPNKVVLLSPRADVHSARPPPPPPPPPPHRHPPPHQHPPPPHDHPSGPKKIDDIKYEIKFKKGLDVKKIFKDFYSIYGPLFIACHIGVSLLSLGFFSTIVYFTIEPVKYLPDALIALIGKTMSEMTGEGGKFVLAYAVHKIILPIRLFGSIWLTRRLSPIVRNFWNRKK